MKHVKILSLLIVLIAVTALAILVREGNPLRKVVNTATELVDEDEQGGPGEQQPHPLSIDALRNGEYPGSDIVIEQTLPAGSNYQRYIASYRSEGLKIYALLTVPNGEKPQSGWPVVIFNHGYIPPTEYRTTERYIAYTDAFSRNGYIVFRSDYRGHGNSEGVAEGGYGSNAYTVDVLNAVASVKKYEDADPNRIGMWGHSMGGHVTLRNMVVNKDVKAGVIWAGVVASYADRLNGLGRDTNSPTPNVTPTGRRGWRNFASQYGTPQENPSFWNSISANSYLSDISGPLQIHHGTADHDVPVVFSERLADQLGAVNKENELYIYPGDDHNLSQNLSTALQRSVEFFDKYVKGDS